MKKKTALITGINGQDGSYLAEFLLKKGYDVHGTKRRSSTITTQKIKHLIDYSYGVEQKGKISIYHADLTDSSSLNRVIDLVEPDEIYNLAAQSHVAVSFEEPEYTANSDALGVLRILEIIKRKKRKYKIKFYQASTSELFGGQEKKSLNENSLINPRSPYAAAKAYAYYLVKQYRDAYNIFCVNGILFNHESPRRGENFVTRKITRGITNILNGKQKYISLGNLNAKRDWGHAKEYVEAMYLMLQKKQPKDYVIGTGKSISIRQFIILSFNHLGIKIKFYNKGIKEFGKVINVDKNKFLKNTFKKYEIPKIGSILIKVDKKLFRPLETDNLTANNKFAYKELNWKPKIKIEDLIKDMVSNDIINDEAI